jgi:hypothetical protein
MANVRRWILLTLALLTASCVWSAPVSAQGLAYFYCYAVDVEQGKVFVSDMHDVGPVAERASYGAQFATYLKVKKNASASIQPYCVMRATEREIQRGRAELTEFCAECGDIRKFEDVAWLREGTGAKALLAGKLISPDKHPEPPAREAQPAPSTPAVAAEREPAAGEGVYILGRRDQTEVVYSANEARGAYLVRQKADLKGGKWTPVLSDSRCPGWVAVSYASNGTERWYYPVQGADSEGEASHAALQVAEAASHRMAGYWVTGVLVAFRNDFRPAPVDVGKALTEDDGVFDAVKGLVRRQVVSGCPAPDSDFVSFGVRG